MAPPEPKASPSASNVAAPCILHRSNGKDQEGENAARLVPLRTSDRPRSSEGINAGSAADARQVTTLVVAKPASPQTPLNANTDKHPLSSEALSLLGTHATQKAWHAPLKETHPFQHTRKIPHNTKRSNRQCLTQFCTFYVKHYNLRAPNLGDKAETVSNPPRKKQRVKDSNLQDEAVRLTRMHLFRDANNISVADNHRDWSRYQLQNINAALIEYIAHVRNVRTGKELAANTLKVYVAGIQRVFESEWGFRFKFFSGPVFSNKNNGIVTALDNKLRERRAAGCTIRSRNTLSKGDIKKLYSSDVLSKQTPRGFITRIIFGLALMTPFRKSEIWALRMKDVTIRVQQGEKVWRLVACHGASGGASTTQTGGWALVNYRPKEAYIRNSEHLDGLVNVFKDLEEYVDLVSTVRGPEDHLLAAVNYTAIERCKFFKRGNLGIHSIAKYVKEACEVLGIVGEGVNDHVTVDGLREIVLSNLSESGNVEPREAVISNPHKSRNGEPSQQSCSLEGYRNHRGTLNRQEQIAIRGNSKGVQITVRETVVHENNRRSLGVGSTGGAVTCVTKRHVAVGNQPESSRSGKRQRVEGSICDTHKKPGWNAVNADYHKGPQKNREGWKES